MIAHFRIALLQEQKGTPAEQNAAIAELAGFAAVEKTISDAVDRALALDVLMFEQWLHRIDAAAADDDWWVAPAAAVDEYERRLDGFAGSPYGRLVQAATLEKVDVRATQVAKQHEIGYYVAITEVVLPRLTHALQYVLGVAPESAHDRLRKVSRLGLYPFAVARDVLADAAKLLLFPLGGEEHTKFEMLLGAFAAAIMAQLRAIGGRGQRGSAREANTVCAEFLTDATPFLRKTMRAADLADLERAAAAAPKMAEDKMDAYFRDLMGAVIIEPPGATEAPTETKTMITKSREPKLSEDEVTAPAEDEEETTAVSAIASASNKRTKGKGETLANTSESKRPRTHGETSVTPRNEKSRGEVKFEKRAPVNLQ